MNYILGSGIVGLLAKHILGPEWTLVPFGKSRFFSFMPPLCDNFIVADPEVDPVIQSLGIPTTPIFLTRVYSSQGNLHQQDRDGALATAWLHKLFGEEPPAHAIPYYKTHQSMFVYPQVRLNKLYAELMNHNLPMIKQQLAMGQLTAIGDHYLQFSKSRTEFSRIVSTIPLNMLLDLLGRPHSLKYKPLYYIHMETRALNFEGANQVFVVDPMFSFFKVSSIAKHRYMFYCHEDIQNAGQYFMPIIPGDYDLLDGTTIANALPMGQMPNLEFLHDMGILTVGSFGQHDFCADIGSNIKKLVRYAARDCQAKKRLPAGFKEL